MKYLEKLEQEVSSWPQVSSHPHRFGGREFSFGSAEIGHIHTGGIVDIPFPRSVRDALLVDRLAEEHHWVPNSGWITFRIRSEQDLKHAFWLMRLSYLRYSLKTSTDPRKLLEILSCLVSFLFQVMDCLGQVQHDSSWVGIVAARP